MHTAIRLEMENLSFKQEERKKEGCLGEKLQSVSVRVDRVSAMGADG